MPHFELYCDSGHAWDVFTNIVHDPEDLKRCPRCGAVARKETPRVSVIQPEITGYDKISPERRKALEHQSLIENKKHLDSIDPAKILSGEVGLHEAGPKQYRKEFPEHLRKVVSVPK